MSEPAPLRLIAEDGEDLAVLSAALQDAVGKIGDIRFEAAARRLTIGLNRFRWEAGGKQGERIRSGLQIGSVLQVQSRRLRREAREAVLSLLGVTFEPGDVPGGTIVLTFAGGGELRVEVECVDAALADVSAPWPTPRRPAHEE
ncbi:MAG: hypothetical protein JWR84_2593 [Caulobacter sp.]|nr:hypothetical protein [Caulobacter sp.]